VCTTILDFNEQLLLCIKHSCRRRAMESKSLSLISKSPDSILRSSHLRLSSVSPETFNTCKRIFSYFLEQTLLTQFFGTVSCAYYFQPNLSYFENKTYDILKRLVSYQLGNPAVNLLFKSSVCVILFVFLMDGVCVCVCVCVCVMCSVHVSVSMVCVCGVCV